LLERDDLEDEDFQIEKDSEKNQNNSAGFFVTGGNGRLNFIALFLQN